MTKKRLQRKPTHRKHEVTGDELIIGFENFRFRGGLPQHRGFCWSDDDSITVSSNSTWETFCNQLKSVLDPGNRNDLFFEIYKVPYHDDRVKTIYEDKSKGMKRGKPTIDPPEESLVAAFIEQGYHLRVFHPMSRGGVDIGTFVPVSNDNENTNQASLIYTESFLSENLLQLIDTFQQTRPLTNKFQFLEDPKIISGDVADALRNHVDKVYNEKKVVEDEGTLGDLQLNLSREELISFIGKESMMELDGLFGQRCEDIVLRRSAKKDHCIDFHVDYSLKTMQISLVDEEEYEGGRLVFVTEGGKLEIPSRKKGSMTIHDDGVIHGVTALKSGVRYGLLLLDRPHLRHV